MRCPAAAGRYTEEILMGKFTTVLYDLDGTLWESGPGITKAVQTALRACGIDEPDPDNLTSFIGPPLNVEFKRRYHFDDEETAKAIAVFRSYYDEKGIYENRLYPGVKKMLKDLKEAGICIGAASSKPQPLVDRLMDYFEIRQYFDVLVGSDPQDELKNKSGSDSKSAIVATALAKAGNPDRKHTAMVGDRFYDMEGAAANGCVPVGAGYGYAKEGELAAAGAVFTAKDVPELENFLLR